MYFLVAKKQLQLQVSIKNSDGRVEFHQPTLLLIAALLGSITSTLESASEEKSVLLNKVPLLCSQGH